MPGGTNQKDLQIISDGVLSGDHTIDQLPKNVQYQLADYWNSLGVDMSNPQSKLTQSQLNALAQQRAENEQGGSFLDSPIFKPIEWVGSKIYQLYSATVAPAVSAGVMALHSIAYGRPDYIGEDGEWDAMKDYWNYAHHISPGQAVWELGLNNKELKERGISPLQMTQDSALARQGMYHDKPTPDDPFGTRTRSDEYFGSGASKYVTGATDFAVSWYADPMVLTGKGLGALKAAKYTRPVAEITAEPSLLGKGLRKITGRPIPSGQEAMDKMFDGSTFQNMVDTVDVINKSHPDSAALVLRRDFPTIRDSANGDPLARLLAQTRSKDEISDVLRVGMGDEGVKTAMEIRNAKIGDQVRILERQKVAHGAYYDGLSDVEKMSLRGQRIKQALDDESAYIQRLENESRVVSDKLSAWRTIDNMNFNSVTTPLGLKIRGALQATDGKLRPVTGLGIVKGTVNLAYNASVGAPIKVVRSYNDIRPTHFIDVNAEDGYRQLNASLQDSGISRARRDAYVSSYIATPINERSQMLMDMEHDIVQGMVDRHNAKLPDPADHLSPELATDLYKEYVNRRRGAQVAAAENGRSYGAAEIDNPNNPGMKIRVNSFDVDGSRTLVSPIFETQLANSHALMNFDVFEDALKAHGSNWMKAKARVGDAWTRTVGVADTLNSMWKFAQLFRLGYGPRALADDFLGQVARFGPMAMAARTIQGGKVAMEDFFNGARMSDRVASARTQQAFLAEHLDNLGREQSAAMSELRRAQALNKPQDVQTAQQLLDNVTNEIAKTKATHADMSKLVATGAQTRDVKIGRQISAGAFAGKQGELFQDLVSGDRNFANLMGSSADWYLKRMRRKQWENITPESAGADEHMEAWIRHVNDQIGHSAVGRQALTGKTDQELANWMRSTPEGRSYRDQIGLKYVDNMELARRVNGEVDYMLSPAMPGMEEIRKAVLQGKLTKEMLEAIPVSARPMVNAERWAYASGQSEISQLMDKAIGGFYRLSSEMPATKLLRNPLFGQVYKNHLADSYSIIERQGRTAITEAERAQLENVARRKALQEVKKYTFTMDHETKMAYAMRHFGAFFGATQESWNRWARIISDKPDVLAHVGQVYSAPARAGLTVDSNGNPVDAAGYSTDPTTGQRRLTKFSDRKILIQIPDYLGGAAFKKATGLDHDASLVLPMSSLNIVLNTGDGALPVGAGPMVQIAANHFAKEDPKFSDWAQKMGVLPFGPQDSWTNFVNPTTGKRLGDSTDDMGDAKQRALFYMMQVEDYKWHAGLRKTQPTWGELKDRADRWTIFRTAAAFGLPFSVNAQDPYQYFRDEYNRMQKLDPKTADEKFYDKYGDSFYMFTQSMSKNNTGLRPTAESVKMSKHYQDLIEKLGPEYAGLVVGSEGDGAYSQGAYYYQRTHSTDVASNMTDRTKMSAREAFDQAQVSRGWQQFRSYMDNLYSQLFDRGLKSFDDSRAADLKNQKTSMIDTLTKQYFPDGSKNPYYNEQWEKQWSSLDKGKYDRTAFDLQNAVDDPELWSKAVNPDGTVGIRSDIFTLRTYLQQRKMMQTALETRKIYGGSNDPTAASNADLKSQWDEFTTKLIEADTKFSWIHSRYFATDMGFNKDVQISKDKQHEMDSQNNSLVGKSAQDFMDVLNNTAEDQNATGY